MAISYFWAMAPTYEIVYLFENPSLIITEVNFKGLKEEADISLKFHWLYYDRTNGALLKLWFRSMDASPSIEERYFEQGYLKFDQCTATFIEKFNSSQHTLENRTKSVPDDKLTAVLNEYFTVNQNSSLISDL